MNQRDRIEEIAQSKKRNSQWHGSMSFDLSRLKMHFEKNPDTRIAYSDFYLVRCVTYLEVFTRHHIVKLVDHSKKYTERAIELAKNFKMDFAVAQGIQGRAVTLGDIIAYNIPVSQFEQIISHFETLLGRKLRPLLIESYDRVDVEIWQKPKAPIIEDYDQMCARLTRLFEVRHIICHELPSDGVYAEDEVLNFLGAAICFAKAMEEVLSFEKYGLTPLTQQAMNARAYEESQQSSRELDEILAKVRGSVGDTDMSLMPPGVKFTELEAFDDWQQKWKQYMHAEAEFMAYQSHGGTIWPTLYESYLTSMTRSRIEALDLWLERESRWSAKR